MLAGCGGGVPAASPSPSASSGAAKPAVSASGSSQGSPPAASKPAGIAAASAAQSTPIKVGVIESLTGVFAAAGKDNQDAFNLYLDSIKSTAAGRKVEVVYVDDAAKPDVGLTKAKQLVESDKVSLIMGVHFSPVCAALASYAKEAQVPVALTGNCPNQGLMSDPKLKSPYLMRFSEVASQVADVAADWAFKNGHRKLILMPNDSVGGLELGDAFASAFIKRGGTVIQELYVQVGTPDFGPMLAQFDQQADLVYAGLPVADGLRFGQQFAGYGGAKKPTVIDTLAGLSSAPNVAQLQDKVAGDVNANYYCECLDTPANQAFVKAWQAKYPGRVLSADAANGYAGAQILAAVINKIGGNVENKQQLLDALHSVNTDTVKGPVKLDSDYDIVQNYYIQQVAKLDSGYGYKLLETYKDVSRAWDRSPKELATFPFGKMKGKWVGMTKDKLDQLIANPPA